MSGRGLPSLAHRLLLVLPLGLAACGGAGTPGPTPEVRVASLAELEKALEQHRGQPVLLNFWATWCPPCVAELPDLVATGKELEGQGLVLLGVSYDLMLPNKQAPAVKELVTRFLEARDLDLPTLLFDAPDYDEIDKRFELPGSIPVTLAFDRAGTLVDRHEGEGSRERFRAMARKALGER